MSSPLTPESFAGLQPVRVLEGRNGTKADVLFFELEDRRVAVKSYAKRPYLIRPLLGRWFTRRETHAYQQLGEVPGLPRFFGRLGAYELAAEWIESRSLAEMRGETVAPSLFSEVRSILETFHKKGVALGDLHHRDVLVTPEGRAFVVDLVTATTLGERPGPVRRALFQRACGADRVGVARMEARFLGLDMEAAIASAGEDAARWHRRGRRLKTFLDRLRGR